MKNNFNTKPFITKVIKINKTSNFKIILANPVIKTI